MADFTARYSFGGQSLSGGFSVSPSAAIYPYPAVSYSALARAGDSFTGALGRLGAVSVVDMAGVATTISNFATAHWTNSDGDGGYSCYVPNAGGIANANISLVPNSSAYAAEANALVTGNTNSLTMLRFSPGNKSGVPAHFSGKLTGTSQGHIYNGLVMYQTNGATIENALIKAIPGSAAAPPGETFPLNLYRAPNTTTRKVEIDGRDANGVPVSSSGIGHNYISTGTMSHSETYVHHIKIGAGITHYMCTGGIWNYDRIKIDKVSHAALNFEQCGGAIVNLTNPTFGVSAVDMIVDANNGSAKVTVTDPVFIDGRTDGKLVVCVHDTYSYPWTPSAPANTQKKTDIVLMVNGVSRPDLIKFVTGYTVKNIT